MKQALSLIGVSFLSVVSSLAADKKPNIILILADDMRASGMNFLGKEQVQTPNLDKLAGEPVDILVNNKLIAKGEVVVIDESFGVRITDIISKMERINKVQ